MGDVVRSTPFPGKYNDPFKSKCWDDELELVMPSLTSRYGPVYSKNVLQPLIFTTMMRWIERFQSVLVRK